MRIPQLDSSDPVPLEGKIFEDVTPAILDAMLRLHVSGAFFVTQAAWPHLVRQRYGRIVMTTSGSGLFGSSHNHDYAAAKAAIAGLTHSLAIDAAAFGITVNAVAPLAATRLADNIEDPTVREAFKQHIRADQIAPLVAWLAHERCRLNGEILQVGGGHIARVFFGVGEGYFNPAAQIADIDTHVAEIISENDYYIPRRGEDTAARLLGMLGVKLS
jgi:NAD(P)-dependent dehydrogenase (short-subunit alcohol dehydrogenase family)